MMKSQTLPLRDIHWPSTVDWWPLAIGWWAVIVLLLCGLIGGGIFAYRWWKRRQLHARIEAQQAMVLDQLADIRQQWDHRQDAASVCAALSYLLRRLCLQYFSRAEFAALYGAPWLDFLQRKHAWKGHCLPLLLELPYQPKGIASAQDIDHLLADTEDWMMAVMVRYG